jgi:hypothetical protein
MIPFGDLIGLYGPTATALFNGNIRSLKNSINESLVGLEEIKNKFETVGYALPNGVVIIHEPDALE